MAEKNSDHCWCGSGKSYADCCGGYLDCHKIPANAEILMRSRYTAYVLLREDYLLITWHSSKRPLTLNLTKDAVKWIKLEVKDYKQKDTGHATVEFIAYYKIGGRMHRLHEVSSFIYENDRWLYLDGIAHENS